MGRLIDDVIDFARGRLGTGITVSIRQVDDLSEPLRAVVDELRVANPSRLMNTQIVLDRPVYCDVARIQQLLSNLLGNALTYGAQDLPIYVRTVTDANQLSLSVSNSGNPIPSHMLPMVFEPYWRPPSGAPGGGLGLGLYICKQIVEAHGGTLEVCSSEADGTCFTARIPMAP